MRLMLCLKAASHCHLAGMTEGVGTDGITRSPRPQDSFRVGNSLKLGPAGWTGPLPNLSWEAALREALHGSADRLDLRVASKALPASWAEPTGAL